MTEKYDSNGEYGATGYTGDFKRKSSSESKQRDMEVNEHDIAELEDNEDNPASQKANEYISELLAEKQIIDHHKFHNAARLIDQEITKVQTLNRVPAREHKYVDIYRERPMKVSAKVLVPVREHPKFNFVGKLLGPKGNSMKRLQEETMCKMAVLGRGSMKDRQKEEELRASCDPKYAHLSDDLHVEISALGPPAEAHARVAFALAEVRKYLIPDNNDNIRMEQMREMDLMTGAPGEETIVYKSSRRPSHHPVMRTASIPRPPVQMRTATRTPVVTPRVMPAKTKILSILDRARIAMEESYGYEDGGNAGGGGSGGGGGGGGTASGGGSSSAHVMYESGEAVYDSYGPPPPQHSHYRTSSSSHHYEGEYEPEYYRESSSAYEPSSQRWKSYKSSSGSTSRHAESSTRYRSSPYTRPSK